MKVLHINFIDTVGGAAIAASRHNEAMNRAGIESKMLVVQKKGNFDKNVISFYQSRFETLLKVNLRSFISSFFVSIFHAFGAFSYSVTTLNVHNHPLVRSADVIYLHWVNNGMISIKEIERILKLGKPVFWYMHDMNPITGGCHYAMDCIGYTKQCNNCPQIEKYKRLNITHRQLKNKLKHWSKYKNFRIVTPSRWLGNCVKNSTVFKGHDITICPNVLDTDIFKPINKQVAREILGIHTSKTLILFGAVNINCEYKGWPYLRKALQQLPQDKYSCVVFGEKNEAVCKQIDLGINFLGYLSDVYSLMIVYNACDVFVIPSLADNYPNVLLESLACGLPCVGFDIGGIPDLIQHQVTGYLAKARDSQALSDGIKYVMENDYKTMSANCRKWALIHGSYEKIMSLHSELRTFILNK